LYQLFDLCLIKHVLTVWPLTSTLACLVTKQCFMVFGRETFIVCPRPYDELCYCYFPQNQYIFMYRLLTNFIPYFFRLVANIVQVFQYSSVALFTVQILLLNFYCCVFCEMSNCTVIFFFKELFVFIAITHSPDISLIAMAN